MRTIAFQTLALSRVRGLRTHPYRPDTRRHFDAKLSRDHESQYESALSQAGTAREPRYDATVAEPMLVHADNNAKARRQIFAASSIRDGAQFE